MGNPRYQEVIFKAIHGLVEAANQQGYPLLLAYHSRFLGSLDGTRIMRYGLHKPDGEKIGEVNFIANFYGGLRPNSYFVAIGNHSDGGLKGVVDAFFEDNKNLLEQEKFRIVHASIDEALELV